MWALSHPAVSLLPRHPLGPFYLLVLSLWIATVLSLSVAVLLGEVNNVRRDDK
jgi:hypothetical protein